MPALQRGHFFSRAQLLMPFYVDAVELSSEVPSPLTSPAEGEGLGISRAKDRQKSTLFCVCAEFMAPAVLSDLDACATEEPSRDPRAEMLASRGSGAAEPVTSRAASSQKSRAVDSLTSRFRPTPSTVSPRLLNHMRASFGCGRRSDALSHACHADRSELARELSPDPQSSAPAAARALSPSMPDAAFAEFPTSRAEERHLSISAFISRCGAC
mmetsp:Transcript_10963/g.29423  ORF Transcript_10963/g.29423 Transcript_10963/m.29423 type:complete len:213 (+) Transcript_10963:339-977(+)